MTDEPSGGKTPGPRGSAAPRRTSASTRSSSVSAGIDTSIAIAGQVDAQVRQEIDEMKVSLAGMQPTVDEWQRIRTIGAWAAGILLTGGLGIGALLAATGDWLSGTIRHWLKL